MTKLPSWLDAGEAIAWRAWEMPASDRASALEMRDKHIWRVPLAPLLAALKAHAEGREYGAPPDEWLTTDEIRAEADRWMHETGRTAAELSTIVERVARLDARTVDLGDPEIALAVGWAADDLRAAAHEERIAARGRSAPGAYREDIPAAHFDEQREIDPFGTLKGPGGKVGWTDVQFRTEDVLREWPEGGEPATGAQPEERAEALHRLPADPPASVGSAPAVRHRFSEGALGAWFILRVSAWSKDVAPPSEADDLAAAREYFDDVPRDVFRVIRRQKVPSNWRKPGPRRVGGK